MINIEIQLESSTGKYRGIFIWDYVSIRDEYWHEVCEVYDIYDEYFPEARTIKLY